MVMLHLQHYMHLAPQRESSI